MKRALPATMLAAALLAGGCGSTSTGTSTTTTPSAAPAPPSPSSQQPAATVTLRNLTFTPHTVTIHLGQTVRWVNKDTVAHNVTAADGQTFKSPTLSPGKSFTYKPLVGGTIPYTCTIHPDMLGTLIVTQ